MPGSLAVLLLLLAASAFFSSAETGLFSLNKFKIRALAQAKNPTALLIEQLRANPRKLLGTILIGNSVVTLSASALAAVIAIDSFGNAAVGAATGVLTVLVIVFGEFLPKAYAAHQPERTALAFARPIRALTVILGPVLAVLERISGFFVSDAMERRAIISEEEIKTMVYMGVESGSVEKAEREMIERVFLFNDITAEDVMTQREQIVYLDGDRTLAEALPFVNTTKFSRFPVFEKNPEQIIGIVYIKDIFEKIVEAGGEAPTDVKIRDIAGPAIFVPETKLIDDLFREFQKERTHIALVINEYGSVVGLVTLDDLLEELVGEISDETDIDEHRIVRIDKLTIAVHGDTEIGDINRFFNVRIEAPDNRTLGWAIMEKLGSLPSPGQNIALAENLNSVVEEMSGRRILKVKLMKSAEMPAKPAPKA